MTKTRKTRGNAAAPTTTPKPDAPKAKKEKKEKVERTDFMTSDAAKGQLNSDNLLTALPANFDSKVHKPLRSNCFADEAVYYDWQAVLNAEKAEAFTKRSKAFSQKADDLRKFGDPATRAKMKRRRKLLDQLEALDEQLEAEGIDLE